MRACFFAGLRIHNCCGKFAGQIGSWKSNTALEWAFHQVPRRILLTPHEGELWSALRNDFRPLVYLFDETCMKGNLVSHRKQESGRFGTPTPICGLRCRALYEKVRINYAPIRRNEAIRVLRILSRYLASAI